MYVCMYVFPRRPHVEGVDSDSTEDTPLLTGQTAEKSTTQVP